MYNYINESNCLCIGILETRTSLPYQTLAHLSLLCFFLLSKQLEMQAFNYLSQKVAISFARVKIFLPRMSVARCGKASGMRAVSSRTSCSKPCIHCSWPATVRPFGSMPRSTETDVADDRPSDTTEAVSELGTFLFVNHACHVFSMDIIDSIVLSTYGLI